MDRRKFIQNGSLAGLSLAAIANGCNSSTKSAEINSSNKADNYEKDDFPINEITIFELQKKMKEGEYSSRKITELYLNRIKTIDQSGPLLNSVIEINPDALDIADKMDQERKAGKLRGPLHGIPILIKDNINTGDQMMTTAGSLALKGNVVTKDAFIIQKLRDAGAVLLGKTNLSEWANFRSTRSSSGWSSRGGQTKNPCVLDRNASGSSSGSAAAVAANLCTIAIGTETDGSIIAPSSFCGIVGIKPTVGLWSRSGIIPISATQDTAGPMTRTVTDAAVLLGALAGEDTADAITTQHKEKDKIDYTSFLNKEGLKGKRIGIQKSFLKGNEAVVYIYNEAIELLKKNGATIVEIDLLKLTKPLGEAEFIVLQYEFKDGVNKYLSNANAKVKSLTEVISFNKQNESTTMPYFKQELLEMCDSNGSLNEKEYTDALKISTSARKIIDDMIQQYQLDAICSTSFGLANCTDLVNGDYDTGFYFAPPAAMAGYPHITVPMGKVHELSIGLSFIAGAYQEGKLIEMAFSFEQASLKRTPPKFLKTLV